jgi:hypothetical protein
MSFDALCTTRRRPACPSRLECAESRRPPQPSHGWPLNACLLDASGEEAYAAYVARRCRDHPYHAPEWRDALRCSRGGQPVYLLAMRETEVAGVLPMFETLGRDGRRRLISLPESPAGGIVADDAPAAWLLVSAALRYAGRRGIDRTRVRVAAFRRGGAPSGEFDGGAIWLRAAPPVLRTAAATESRGRACDAPNVSRLRPVDLNPLARIVHTPLSPIGPSGLAVLADGRYGEVLLSRRENGGALGMLWWRSGRTICLLGLLGNPTAPHDRIELAPHVASVAASVQFVDLAVSYHPLMTRVAAALAAAGARFTADVALTDDYIESVGSDEDAAVLNACADGRTRQSNSSAATESAAAEA